MFKTLHHLNREVGSQISSLLLNLLQIALLLLSIISNHYNSEVLTIFVTANTPGIAADLNGRRVIPA